MQRDAAAKTVEAERKPESRSSIRHEEPDILSQHPIVALQQTAGNRAVGRLLQAGLGVGRLANTGLSRAMVHSNSAEPSLGRIARKKRADSSPVTSALASAYFSGDHSTAARLVQSGKAAGAPMPEET